MFNYSNYLISDEHQTWRSACDIEIAALKHEERRIQTMHENVSKIKAQAQLEAADRKAGFLSFLRAPMYVLSTLLG